MTQKNTRRVVLPILDIRDLGPDPFLSDENIPADIKAELRPGQKVVYIDTPKVSKTKSSPSSMNEIMRLTDADRVAEIGYKGPSIASLSSEANEDEPEMTRYETPHGRDALRVAMDLHEEYPSLLASTIVELAEKQGVMDESYVEGQPFRQEEKGKIMLLDRPSDDPVGRRFSEKLGWGWPFYGSIDATPSFVSALSTYVLEHDSGFLNRQYTSREKDTNGTPVTRKIESSLYLAVSWLLKKTEQTVDNPEGFLEFRNIPPHGGMLNQAWEDNVASYMHKDGSWPNHKKGIASVEVQALAYDAMLDAARVFRELLGDRLHAAYLEKRAGRLREVFMDRFWTEDKGGYFVQATDRDENGELRQLKVRGSNMGHLLNSRILKNDDKETSRKSKAVIKSIFSPGLMSPHGPRTLASDEVAFREGGYHTGSVWLWDVGYIARGLERHGYDGLAWHLRRCILDIVWQTGSFPEFIKGDDSVKVHLNQRDVYVYDPELDEFAPFLFEQLPQEVQAWSVSVILAMKYQNDWNKAAEDLNKRSLEKELLAMVPRMTVKKQRHANFLKHFTN